MITYDDVSAATAAQASLGEALAPRLGRTVGVNFCALVPPKVCQIAGVRSSHTAVSAQQLLPRLPRVSQRCWHPFDSIAEVKSKRPR